MLLEKLAFKGPLSKAQAKVLTEYFTQAASELKRRGRTLGLPGSRKPGEPKFTPFYKPSASSRKILGL